MTSTSEYLAVTPDRESSWRSIVLFGRNVASYKFALAEALLTLDPQSDEVVTLEQLAAPYAEAICRHLKSAERQTTSRSSQFLDACRRFNAGTCTHDDLVEVTIRLGFENVIDAFHVVNQADVPHRFFVDERAARKGIRLTADWRQLASAASAEMLPKEVESRWRLVETAWASGLNVALIEADVVGHEVELLIRPSPTRRVGVTKARGALSGYQKGSCFYCFRPLRATDAGSDAADVDHFLPWALQSRGLAVNLDGVWNLVLACRECNRGSGGKFMRVPTKKFLERLWLRNEYYIASHHPLRETIIAQTGSLKHRRRHFLEDRYQGALLMLPHPWEPTPQGDGRL